MILKDDCLFLLHWIITSKTINIKSNVVIKQHLSRTDAAFVILLGSCTLKVMVQQKALMVPKRMNFYHKKILLQKDFIVLNLKNVNKNTVLKFIHEFVAMLFLMSFIS